MTVREYFEERNWLCGLVELAKASFVLEDITKVGRKVWDGGKLGHQKAYPRKTLRGLQKKYAGWERDLIKLAKELPVENLSLTTLYRILAKRNSLKSPDTIRHRISKPTRDRLKNIIRRRKQA